MRGPIYVYIHDKMYELNEIDAEETSGKVTCFMFNQWYEMHETKEVKIVST